MLKQACGKMSRWIRVLLESIGSNPSLESASQHVSASADNFRSDARGDSSYTFTVALRFYLVVL